MKRAQPLRRKKGLGRGAEPLGFGVAKNDVLCFRVRLADAWEMGSVISETRAQVVLETNDLRHHTVPRDRRHLRLPHASQLGGYQIAAENARHERAMAAALPALSAPVVVRAGGAAAAVPKRRKRYRSEDYLDHVRSLPAADGGEGPVEPHHVNERRLGGDRGVSQKSDDYNCVPLSSAAHQHLTRTRRLPGKTRAQTERALLLALVATLKSWIEKHEEAPAEAEPAADSADERLTEALEGRGSLRRLAAVAGAVLVLCFSPGAFAAGQGGAHAVATVALAPLLLLGLGAVIVLRQRAPRRLSLGLAPGPRRRRDTPTMHAALELSLRAFSAVPDEGPAQALGDALSRAAESPALSRRVICSLCERPADLCEALPLECAGPALRRATTGQLRAAQTALAGLEGEERQEQAQALVRIFGLAALLLLLGAGAAQAATEGGNTGGGSSSHTSSGGGGRVPGCPSGLSVDNDGVAYCGRPALLVLGEQELQTQRPELAREHCREAARQRGPHRGAALVCQGRAALALRAHAEAERLARAALREPLYPGSAYVLLGDALRAPRGGCPAEARTAYLDAREALPGDPDVARGLRACNVDLPDLAQAPAPRAARQPRRRPRRRRRGEAGQASLAGLLLGAGLVAIVVGLVRIAAPGLLADALGWTLGAAALGVGTYKLAGGGAP